MANRAPIGLAPRGCPTSALSRNGSALFLTDYFSDFLNRMLRARVHNARVVLAARSQRAHAVVLRMKSLNAKSLATSVNEVW